MRKTNFTEMAYKNENEFVFGYSKKPVTLKNGLVIGGGQILPELNFTLPTMSITKETMSKLWSSMNNGSATTPRDL